jgi:hypothetical protein
MTNEMTATARPVTVFVRKHALLFSSCGAFLVAWLFWFLEPCLRGREGLAANLFIKVGTYGPVPVVMLVSALFNPDRALSALGPRLLAGGT